MSLPSVIVTHALVILFGLGSWIAINGLWVELPLLVNELPEGWELGSYLAVIIQLANIGPVCFTLWSILSPRKVKEKLVAYGIICIGIASCLLLAFFWDRTSHIGGVLHSTALLILQFFLALVDCTSSVVFLPYMSALKETYLMTYYVGEGLSGLLPSVVALGQGVGGVKCVNSTNHTGLTPVFLDPHFPVEDFFYFLFAMMLVCGASFALLNNLKLCQLEYAPVKPSLSGASLLRSNSDHEPSNRTTNADRSFEASTSESDYKSISYLGTTTDSSPVDPTIAEMPRITFFYLLFLILVINSISNGAIPSVQSYSSLPYGTSTYHYAVTLGSIVNPAACFFAFFLPATFISVITCLTVFGLGIAGYIIAMACASPSPILVDSVAGSILIVCAWVLVTFLLTYAKVNIAILFRRQGHRALLWCGAITQLGSFIGAIIMFVFVSVLKVFVSAPYC